MTQSQDDSAPLADEQLARWLREANQESLHDVSQALARGRSVLLERLAVGPEVRPLEGQGHISPKSRRMIWGGIGASLAAAAVIGIALLLSSLNGGKPLSAMERTTKELQAVTSYSYRLHWKSTWREQQGKRSITSQGDGETYWSAPSAFHNTMVIKRTEHDVPEGNRNEKVIEHFAEIFPAGQQGVLIDYAHKTWIRIPYEPTGSITYPLDLLRMIREGSYMVQKDLGLKRLNDIEAHGFTLLLQNAHTKEIPRDPVELWVDAKTNLPIEFSYQGKNAGSTYVDLATDFRWNTPLDPKLFVPVIPPDFVDITPPTDPRELAQIADALRLFAELSGGHYPRGKKFDARQVREEMLKLAGFTGDPQPDWHADPKHQRIEAVAVGLGRIERALRLRWLCGYRGDQVGPHDKNEVLLWWSAAENGYRVFYGDLRTEIISEAEWKKLMPEGGDNDDREK